MKLLPPNVMDVAALHQMASRCPLHRWLGVQAEGVNDEHIELSIPWREEILSNPDRRTVHGGILATLIDMAGAYAISVRLGRVLPTVDIRTDYHAVARPGSRLTVRAHVINLGRSLGTAGASIFDDAGTHVASGRGTYFVAPLTPRPNT
jgi:uncharacterized protein (TIGR00369 family)